MIFLSGTKNNSIKQPFWNNVKVVPYLYILPNMILFMAFMIIPIFMTGYYSLTKWSGMGNPEFIGIKNYAYIFHDNIFITAFWNTLLFSVITVPLMMLFALMLAVLLNQKLYLRGFFRSAIYMPAIISTVCVGMTFTWIFNSNVGLVNYLLNLIGQKGVNWNNDPKYAMSMIIMVTLWSRIGYNMVIYLAGLQGISPEYYEAATIDGASAWHKLRYITIPLLKPTTTFIMITCVIFAFRSFDLIYVMTKGGPLNATTTLVVYIYNEAFQMNYIGRASAAGIILFLMLLVFTIIKLKTDKENA